MGAIEMFKNKWKTKNIMKEIVDILKYVGIGFMATYIFNLLFQPIYIQGPSMTPTVLNEEKMMVNKAIYYIQEPQRGDIVVFTSDKPLFDKEEKRFIIKRIVGVEGDKVEFKNGVLYINHQMVNESYLNKEFSEQNKVVSTHQQMLFTEDFGPITVPKGQLFVVGDNRPQSTDSRVFGTISKERVIGRGDLVFWPIQNFRITH